ncbi:hypothetical protein BX666DRAFT_2001350 [Dichotomocladium elegans]|nr:hypothetical protein BX666DRAFT_2001350 [Dichotomocladium elegans]
MFPGRNIAGKNKKSFRLPGLLLTFYMCVCTIFLLHHIFESNMFISGHPPSLPLKTPMPRPVGDHPSSFIPPSLHHFFLCTFYIIYLFFFVFQYAIVRQNKHMYRLYINVRFNKNGNASRRTLRNTD